MTDLVTTEWQRVRRLNVKVKKLKGMDKDFSKTSLLGILTDVHEEQSQEWRELVTSKCGLI